MRNHININARMSFRIANAAIALTGLTIIVACRAKTGTGKLAGVGATAAMVAYASAAIDAAHKHNDKCISEYTPEFLAELNQKNDGKLFIW